MKYLKKFNESKDINKSQYYAQISNKRNHEYLMGEDVPEDFNYVNINKNTIRYIKNLFKPYLRYLNIIKIRMVNIDRALEIKINGFTILLSEVEDEYFIINLNSPHEKFIKSASQIYKCDQLDGVKELFIDKGIIKE